MTFLLAQYETFIADGFDPLGAIVMVIDGQPEDVRFEPTIELLESIGYERRDTLDITSGEYSIRTAAGQGNEQALRSFIVRFMMGKQLIQYQPINRLILRGKSCLPHRPDSDFRFADWYPNSRGSGVHLKGKIEDQIGDEFPNAASAAQFLHEQGFKRSNTHKKLAANTYFVASRHGDGQPSGIVFRGEHETFFYDFYADDRFIMGASGLLKDHRPTQRQFNNALSMAAMNLPF